MDRFRQSIRVVKEIQKETLNQLAELIVGITGGLFFLKKDRRTNFTEGWPKII
jgi:hypothetical protein